MAKFLKFDCNLENFISQLIQRLDANNNKIENLLKQETKTYANFVKSFCMHCIYQYFVKVALSIL